MIHTDLCIIGAGPVGLFAVFEAGLLKMRCHVMDVLPQIGGQLSEIYPKKPIYDIPGYPVVLAQELVDNLAKQIEPFNPSFTLGERVEKIERQEDESFILETNEGTQCHAKAVVIAGGLGCFEPRKPALDRLESFEGKGVDYMVRNPEKYINRKVVIAGGGDSALDWTIYLAEHVEELTLVHRGSSFRGAPDSAEKVLKLAEEGKLKLMLNSQVSELKGEQLLNECTITNKAGETETVSTDFFIPLFGLSPKLGPIANWNLNLDKNAIEVNVEDYSTNVPGVYAIGDINQYPGKLKLILSGFHEAALMAQSAYRVVSGGKKASLKYTTVNGIQTF
ncbi:NAD(P)/FAD-dependent oxidoreductase [Porifericola rhodea]|uniref:NAD(P)/FAD-dependent oxidoreductase n=1 Tax=Porifericola rhodea TaxID=930972 RepID=UPI002665A547|nr:NAD(P)/FAD-dependent oxidoreductase [Porifericola rhodea]WKN31928.1 NAD(P)/FAD-dependent oxidoreductase [Porifericola rhodea]